MEKLEIIIFINDIYETLPIDLKTHLNVKKIKNIVYNDKKLFYKSLIESFNSKPITSYNRDELNRWYNLFSRYESNLEIKRLKREVERELIINIGIEYRNYRYFSEIDRVIDRAIRSKRGYRNGFCNFDGFYINSDTDVIIRLRVDRVDDYSSDRTIKDINGTTYVFEKKNIRIIGYYTLYNYRTFKELKRKRFELTISYPTKEGIGTGEYFENSRERERGYERLKEQVNDLLDEIIREIKMNL